MDRRSFLIRCASLSVGGAVLASMPAWARRAIENETLRYHFQQSYTVLNFIRILIRHKSICRWLKTDFLNRFNGEKILNAELCYHNR